MELAYPAHTAPVPEATLEIKYPTLFGSAQECISGLLKTVAATVERTMVVSYGCCLEFGLRLWCLGESAPNPYPLLPKLVEACIRNRQEYP